MWLARGCVVGIVGVALTMAMSQPALSAARNTHRPAGATRAAQLATAAVDIPKLTVRLTPLVRLTRGDALAAVIVPRNADNRLLRVILESQDYYSLSEVPLDG